LLARRPGRGRARHPWRIATLVILCFSHSLWSLLGRRADSGCMHRGAGKLADSEAVPYRMLHLYQPVCNPFEASGCEPCSFAAVAMSGGNAQQHKEGTQLRRGRQNSEQGLDMMKIGAPSIPLMSEGWVNFSCRRGSCMWSCGPCLNVSPSSSPASTASFSWFFWPQPWPTTIGHRWVNGDGHFLVAGRAHRRLNELIHRRRPLMDKKELDSLAGCLPANPTTSVTGSRC
jgi:hypothetical protein